LDLSGLGIHRSYLLKLGVEIYSYNDHVRLLSPEPVGWFCHYQLYPGVGADIVMESISLINLGRWQKAPNPTLHPAGAKSGEIGIQRRWSARGRS
jgi:hypothetical protein